MVQSKRKILFKQTKKLQLFTDESRKVFEISRP